MDTAFERSISLNNKNYMLVIQSLRAVPARQRRRVVAAIKSSPLLPARKHFFISSLNMTYDEFCLATAAEIGKVL